MAKKISLKELVPASGSILKLTQHLNSELKAEATLMVMLTADGRGKIGMVAPSTPEQCETFVVALEELVKAIREKIASPQKTH